MLKIGSEFLRSVRKHNGASITRGRCIANVNETIEIKSMVFRGPKKF